MKISPNRVFYASGITILFFFLTFFPVPGHAQSEAAGESGGKGSDSRDIKVSLYAETGLLYTDNVYGLSDAQASKMETNDADDQASGRYRDMESRSDYIISPTLGFECTAENPLGGRVGFLSRFKYNYYNKNDKSSYPELRIRLKNSIGENGSLSAEGDISWGIFKRNYLSSVNDINGNGNIPRSERTYSAAVYDEYEGIIAYEHKIINDKDKTLSGLDVRPFIGISSRTFNSKFSNRDLDITSGGIEAGLEFLSKIDLELIYRYEDVSSPNDIELCLFDETIAWADVNGDGDIKGNAPLLTRIDRSARRRTIEINPSFKLSKEAALFLGYEYRTTSYTSDNPLDIEHYNNDASRSRIKSGIRYKFSKEWSVEAEYSKEDNDDDEDGEYSQNSFLLTLKFDIL